MKLNNYLRYFIFLFIFSSQTLWGQSDFNKHFKNFYYSSEISARHCGENISAFMRYLTRQKFQDHKSILIVSMTSPGNPWSFGNVVTLNSRWGNAIENHFHHNYAFHVFAIYKGHAYDFTFAQEPKILPTKEYLKEMYIPHKPILLYGESFRVRGMGPEYNEKHAMDELNQSEFKLFNTDSRGTFNLVQESASYQELFF
jgi:hypothetical protein